MARFRPMALLIVTLLLSAIPMPGPAQPAAPGSPLTVQVTTEPPGLDLTATPASATATVVFYNIQEALVKGYAVMDANAFGLCKENNLPIVVFNIQRGGPSTGLPTKTEQADLLQAHPMRGIAMRVPKTLPTVPEDDAVRRLLAACPDTFEGRRNKALVALLADSGLRISEALRLRIEDMSFAARTIHVRGGKGGKDGVGFFGAEAAQCLRAWLARRLDVRPEDFLFCDRQDRGLTRSHGTHILHNLSKKAGLSRKIGPHALRHYAATAILRQTGDLELVRQVLRHESLAMALRYARLTRPDVSAKFRRASPLDNLKAGR